MITLYNFLGTMKSHKNWEYVGDWVKGKKHGKGKPFQINPLISLHNCMKSQHVFLGTHLYFLTGLC